MEFRLLGGFEVLHGGETVAIRGAKQRVLLALLALRRGDVVAAEQLAEAIWGEAPPGNPANALQAQVSALRKLLPEPVVVTRGNGYSLEVAADQVDIERFESMVAAGRRALEQGDAAGSAALLRDALALWRGPALADFAYDEFARVDIARLEEARLAAVEARIEADLATGRDAEVIPDLEALCAAHPLREGLWGHLMVALYRCGRQADALRAYRQARERLVAELGIEPGPQLRRVEAMVLAQDDALERRAPQRAAPGSRGNLRARLTSLVGRDAELKEIGGLLAGRRLVTLVGPGGVGKTRLAVEAAERATPERRDGAWLVELASVTDRAGVTTAVATGLGVGDAATMGDHPVVDAAERLAGFLVGRDVVIVLDSCEHVVAEAATLVEQLLGFVPDLRILATSREPLGVPGEALLAVPPLAEAAAVELFAERARSVDRTFALDDATAGLVLDVCRRLDGLPLAIELAAARLRALPVGVLASRLDDRFRLLTGGARTALPRHQTLRAVVDWSYDLLFEDERRLFARLSVFPGGCTAEAAEAVCADEALPPYEIVDLLARLVDKSLLTVQVDCDGQPRYRQLQTLWHYAREKLAESGDAAAVRDRHAAWCCAVAEGAEQGLRGADGPMWRARISAEVDNLRAALDWLIETRRASAASRLAIGTAWWWFLRADWQEGARWLGDTLSAGDMVDVERARAQAWYAYFAAVVDGPAAHLESGRAALEVVREHGPPMHVGEVALLHASTLNRALRFEEAIEVLEVAQIALGEVEYAWGLAVHDLLAANALSRLGRLEDAESAARASVERFEEIGERWAIVEPMGAIAALREARGDPDGALAAYDRVIATTRPLELPGHLALWLIARGAMAARSKDDGAAMDDFSEAIALGRNPVNTGIALVGRARAAARRGAPAEDVLADLDRADALFVAVGRRDGRAAACVADGLLRADRGDLAAARDRAAEAARLEPEMAHLLAAACAHHDGRADEAAARLRLWDEAHRPVLPGSLAAVLQRDRDQLQELRRVPHLRRRLSHTAAEPQRRT